MLQNKKLGKNLLIIFGLIALASFFGYSLFQYQKSGAQYGVTTCANGQCFWSAHVHTYIPIRICGKAYPLAKFEGPLSDAHTHGEENLIHWHGKLPYDPENKVFLEPSPFVLRTTLTNQGIQMDTGKTFGKKDGDVCDGEKSAWKVFINGAHFSDWLNYEWKDHDVITFIFDEKTGEEIEKELRQNPVHFPSVGEG